MVGNEAVFARLEGQGKRAGLAQLYSRVGIRVTQARPLRQGQQTQPGPTGFIA